MSTKHAPAPWRFLCDTVWLQDPRFHTAGRQRYLRVIDDRGNPVALVHCDEDDAEAQASAQVLRAAPDMLAALRELLRMEEAEGNAGSVRWSLAYDAIAKAGG